MAFGGGGGFSFGNNNNNNNQSTGFGGFGNNTNTGFGASTTNTGFGSSTAGTNPFGGGTSTFGSNTGGFGASTTNTGSSLFGNKPAATNPFGTTTGTTSLFGGNNNNNATTNTGFGSGGFGSTANTGGFGSTNNNAGSAFSFGNNANKPAFGSSTTTPLFGQGGTGTTGGFGSTSAFGSGTGTALNQPVGPSDGTASTPFAPFSDKEPNGVTNNYQSIVFQQPYSKYSFEELRLADYNAGRQFGNASGQPGAFGSNAFGGGFGASNTGGFGSTNTSTNLFGATTSSTTFGNNTATSGFGGGTGLFGNTANKPAGGLFGSTTTSAGTTGGLFGTSNNATTGFGSGNTGFGANTSTGGGLFGQNNQAKPAGGLFGNTAGTTNNAFSFGQNNNNNNNTGAATGGGLFGNNNNQTANTGGSLFGNTNQAQQTNTGGLFGNTNNTQGNSLFGANKTGTGFGTQAATGTTGGLFGSTANNTSTGGLFGNNNTTGNTNTGTGLFGNSPNTGGGLFGNNNNTNQAAAKPLFGSGFGSNTTANAGGGLFSNNNNATTNQNSGGLFGNNNNASGGFSFGNNNANKPSGGLFGSTNNAQQGTGLFGSSNNGLLGQSQNNQQSNQQQQEGFKHASLLDPNPYGQSSIWTGLPAPTPENSKPVFTPLTATQKLRESTMKPPPSLKLNQSRYMTPPRRNGFGFSYSTYGTPNSAASTPGGAGLSGSMYGSRGFSGGSFGRSFNKSVSVQNLRSQFTSDSDDIWKPGAFASTHRNSGGSIKRLTIDRSIRNDLFSRPSLPALPTSESHSNINGGNAAPSYTSQANGDSHHDTSNKLKKRVSFENGTSGGLQNSQLNGETGALVRTERDDDEMDESDGRTNGTANEIQSRGKDLDAVPEDRESHSISKPAPSQVQAKADPKPGDYWMSPSRAEQSKMPREQLKAFKDFQVGRVGCGQVTFNGTVDLTALPMDDLYDTIVEIRVRSITVYPDVSMKPPVGKGLNVPSTIVIENSWPRSRNQPSSATSGPLFDKHIQRLKKMPGTDFVGYKAEAGIWTFRVPHYTRYGLDYDDDDEELSELTTPPDTIEKSAMEVDSNESDEGNDYDDEDDTFAFRQKTVPGGFGRQSAVDYEPPSTAPAQIDEQDQGSEHSVYSDEDMSEDEPSIVGSFPAPTRDLNSSTKPNIRPVQRRTPGKALLDLEGDWAEQLQRTISPRKQNRDMLRETQNKVIVDRIYSPIKPKTIEKKDFRTSIDVMNSLFGLTNEQGNHGARQRKTAEPEFEFPYAKRAKTFDSSLDDLSEADRKWHESFRTQFTGVGDLIYRKSLRDTSQQTEYSEEKLVGNRGGVVVKSSLKDSSVAFNFKFALASTEMTLKDSVPYAQRQKQSFSHLGEHSTSASDGGVESDLYNLLHILFDDYEDEFTNGLPPDVREQYEPQIRKDRLTKFISSYVTRKHSEKLSRVERENSTAAAIIKLTAKDIKGACDLLEKAKNYKLMVLVSQLENADKTFQDDVKAQIDAWRDQRVLSEMTEDIRTVYELCAGNTTISAGTSGNNVPVEDKAKTFSIADEYGLDWIQSFALGLWFGREEKNHASATGVVSIEDAVVEFSKRCDSKEESQTPGNDPIWVILKLYAAKQGMSQIQLPIFPTALEALNKTWDASKAFNLHHSIAANIDGVTIDEDAEEDLTGLLAYQLSSRGDIAAAAYTLLHLEDSQKREAMLQNLLERFAGQLPDPPSTSATNAPNSEAVSTIATANNTTSAELWTTLTVDLHLPESWLYNSKALHARATSDSTRELNYLVAAKSWDAAHECFVHRVAPALVVDDDIALLGKTVDLFGGEDVLHKIENWETGGGVYADYALLCTARPPYEQGNIEGLRLRLVELGRRLKNSKTGENVDLGKLSVEELEERVALHEMSRVVAKKSNKSPKDLLELPLTSDQRLSHTIEMANQYFRGVTAGGDV